jgi:hypothetical protein
MEKNVEREANAESLKSPRKLLPEGASWLQSIGLNLSASKFEN